jgi:hypothetical protein
MALGLGCEVGNASSLVQGLQDHGLDLFGQLVRSRGPSGVAGTEAARCFRLVHSFTVRPEG